MVAGGQKGRDSLGVWDGHVHTAVFKTDNPQGPTAGHGALFSVSCGGLDGRGVWGRMDACICMAEFFCCAPETITTLSISCTLTQKEQQQSPSVLDCV